MPGERTTMSVLLLHLSGLLENYVIDPIPWCWGPEIHAKYAGRA